MPSQKYEPIFKIEVTNTFYQSLVSESLVIIPTDETNRRFANFHLKARSFENGVQVYYETKKVGVTFIPVIPISEIPDHTRFTFLIQTKNSQYGQNSQLSGGQPGSYGTLGNEVYYFDNWGLATPDLLPANTMPQKIAVCPPIINFSSDATGGSSETLNIYGPDDPNGTGTPLLTLTVPLNTTTNTYDVQVDLVQSLYPMEPPKGKYMFKLGAIATQYKYIDENLLFQKPFGIIDIRKPASGWPMAPVDAYTIHFVAAPLRWRYHFVFRSGTYPPPDGSNTYEVDDTVGGLIFVADGTVGTNPVEALFKSTNSEIAQEYGRVGISLKHNGTPIITDLPNPTAEHLKQVTTNLIFAEIFVYL